MITPLISLFASLLLLGLTLILFSFERKRGLRFLTGFRSHLDFNLLKLRHTWNVGIRNWGRYFIRQVIHYFFHTLLTGTINGLTALEERLKTVARTNRALARKSERERSSLNKLEEVALHKLEVALTEEEKRIRRKQSLEG
jgi:hypothetical protein